jgi:hypothetical protein
MTSKLRSELTAVNAALCLLITLGCLPVLIWHSWGVLFGIARVSLLGYGIADLALWSAARWSSTASSGLVRGVALASKASLAALLLFTSASVIALHADKLEANTAADTAATREIARLEALATQAERLADTAGRRVARDFVTAAGPAGTSTATGTPAPSSSTWREYLPTWWPTLGVVAVPPLAGLFVLVLLSACIGLAGGAPVEVPATTEEPLLPARRVGFREPTPLAAYAQTSRSSEAPACGGTRTRPDIQIERKKDNRLEAWIRDTAAPRGKRYLTSFSANLPAADQESRINAALQRKAVAV